MKTPTGCDYATSKPFGCSSHRFIIGLTGTHCATQKPFGCSIHKINRGYYSPLFMGVMHQHNVQPLTLLLGTIQGHANIKRSSRGNYSLFMSSSGSRNRRLCWRAFPASNWFDVHAQRRGRAYPIQGGGVVITQSVGQIWPSY